MNNFSLNFMEVNYFTSILKTNNIKTMKKLILFFTIINFFSFIIWCTNQNTDSYNIKELNETKIEFLINKVPFRNYTVSRSDISKEMFIQWWKDQSDMYTTKWDKIYFYGRKIKWADITTFIPLVADYALDKDHIYIWHEVLSIPLDQFNFVSWAIDYLTDWENIYWWDKKIEWADLESFIGMWFENPINNMWYAKDKNNYYLRWEILTWKELEKYLEKI